MAILESPVNEMVDARVIAYIKELEDKVKELEKANNLLKGKVDFLKKENTELKKYKHIYDRKIKRLEDKLIFREWENIVL